MAGNILDEIKRYIRRPKITFEKGIMRSDDDSRLGYVSDIKNIEIDKNVAKRRQGSRLLNDPDTAVKYKKLFWSTISGCDILFAITESLELVAYVDRWLEIEFKVYKKGLSKLRYDNSSNSFQVKWDQGNQFFVVESNDSIKIVNDFGQIYKIEKRGYINLLKTKDADFTYDSIDDNRTLEMMEEARYYTDSDFPTAVTEFGLFLNIIDATNKAPESFYLIPESSINLDKTIYPIDGDVRVAYVNDDNIISKLSNPINIDQADSYFISKISGFSGHNNFVFLTASDTDAVPNTDCVIRGIANGTTSGVNGSYNYYVQSSFSRPSYSTVKAKLILVGSSNFSAEYYIYFDGSSDDLTLGTDNLDKFFRFDVVKRFDPEPLDAESISTTIGDKYTNIYIITNVIAEVDSYETSAAAPGDYTTYDSITINDFVTLTCSADNSNTIVKLRNTAEFNSLIQKIELQGGFKKADSLYGAEQRVPMKIVLNSGSTFKENIIELFEINIRIDSSNNNIEGVLNYENKYFSDASSKYYSYQFKDLGYDCWKNVGEFNNRADITSVNLYNGSVGIPEERSVMVNYNDLIDYLVNGNRFAIWNNNEIIAISQRGLTNNGTDFIYENELTLYSSPIFCEPCISQTDTEFKGGTGTDITYGNGSITLNGTTSKISYSGTESTSFGQNWTIIAIFNKTTDDSAGFVVSKAGDTGDFSANMVMRPDGNVGVYDKNENLKDLGVSFTAGTKQFVAITTSEESSTAFVNGTSGSSTNITNAHADNIHPIVVGARAGTTSVLFDGEIYAVFMFPTSFTISQIEDIYNDGNYDAWFLKQFQTNNYGYAYNQPILSQLDYAYSPICAPVFKTLRSFDYKIDSFEDIITAPDHIVNNNGKLYVVQGQRLWGGNYRTMKLTTPKDLDYSVYRMEKFFDGVALFTTKGIYRVAGDYSIYQVNTSAISSDVIKASTEGNGMAWGITENNEVFYIMIVVENNSTPYAKAVKISDPIHNLNWSSNPKMEYIKDTLWIARDTDVWGFYENGWKKKYEFDDKQIDRITNYKNNLCISFVDKRTIDVYDTTQIVNNLPIITET